MIREKIDGVSNERTDGVDGVVHQKVTFNSEIIKRYFKGNVGLHIHFGVWSSECKLAKFCAIFHRADEHSVFAISEEEITTGVDLESLCLHGSSDDIEQLVLIPNVKTVQKPEGMTLGISRFMVRLQALNNFYNRLARAFHLSWASRLVFSGIEEDGELGFHIRSFPCGKHKLTYEQVEGGSEVVNGISGDSTPTKREDMRAPNPYDVLSCIRLSLYNDTVRTDVARYSKHFIVQVSEVLFGPLDLRPGAV